MRVVCEEAVLKFQIIPRSITVSVQLDQLVAVNPSTNRLNPYEKYIELLTADGHEFWFMGFVSYDKALKNLTEALQHYGARI